MNNDQLLALIAETDAYAPDSQLPASNASRTVALREIERRVSMTSTKTDAVTVMSSGAEPPRHSKRWPRALVASAAFALTIIVIGVVAWAATSRDGNQPVGSDDLPAIANEFFTAHNAGDADAVMALLAPNPSLSDNWSGAITREDFQMSLVWDTAQGTVLSDPTCEVTAEAGEQTLVECDTATYNAPAQAAGANPVPTHLSITVNASGINILSFFYGDPDFTTVTYPFEQWVWNHRTEDATKIGHGRWTSVDEARANGLLTARFAQEWADYLEANECSITERCARGLP